MHLLRTIVIACALLSAGCSSGGSDPSGGGCSWASTSNSGGGCTILLMCAGSLPSLNCGSTNCVCVWDDTPGTRFDQAGVCGMSTSQQVALFQQRCPSPHADAGAVDVVVACGHEGEACCATATPCAMGTDCQGGMCRAPCGRVDEPCCAVGQACVSDAYCDLARCVPARHTLEPYSGCQRDTACPSRYTCGGLYGDRTCTAGCNTVSDCPLPESAECMMAAGSTRGSCYWRCNPGLTRGCPSGTACRMQMNAGRAVEICY